MFYQLNQINTRPKPYEFYTAADLWTDPHTAQQMLQYHLNKEIDAASRNHLFIDKSVDFIISHFHLDPSKEVIDFGCGPGLYTTKLAKKGVKVTGLDFSENSLNYAKEQAVENNLQIDYHLGNYLEFETDKQFDLITMIMCDYCALSPDQRKMLLSKFKNLLKPDGSVLLDIYTLNAFDQKEESAYYELNQLNGFWSADEYYGFVNHFKYDIEKVVLDKYTIIEAKRERVVYNWLQHYSPDSIEKEFEENGFKIKEMFADVAGTEFDSEGLEMAVVAKVI